MSWRLRLSVETILRLTPAVLGSTVFSIAGLCAAHACLDDQALLAAREAIDDVVARLRAHGTELVGELAQYENSYRLCYVRGPEGILVALAEKIG